MEAVDPTLKPFGTPRTDREEQLESNMEPLPRDKETGRRGSTDATEQEQSAWWRTQIESLQKQIDGKDSEIEALRTENEEWQRQLGQMPTVEQKQRATITELESHSKQQQQEQLSQLENQNKMELHRLDSSALKMELDTERMRTDQLRSEQTQLEQALFTEKEKVKAMEQMLRNYEEQKMELIERTNEQMNQLREYLLFYQKHLRDEESRREE